MRYYTIDTNGGLTIADSIEALSRFYNEVLELPEDYEEGKYIVVDVEKEIDVPDYDEDGNPIMVEYEDTETVIDYDEEGNPIGTHEITVIKEKQSTHKETVPAKVLVLNPSWEEERKQKERERLDALYMTRSDFFDDFILAFNLGQSELRAIVEQILNSINITDVEIKVALNNYDNALNFYRKHTLFVLLNNVEIPISEDISLVFTSDIWDKFFDTKDYRELQKAIKVKNEDTTNTNE